MSLPMDLINDFRTRPQPISVVEYKEKQRKISLRIDEVVSQGEQLEQDMNQQKRSFTEKRKHKQRLLMIERMYNDIIRENRTLEIANKLKGDQGGAYVLWGVFKLLAGILCMILSICWIVHIVLFYIPATPVHDFLNTFFLDLERMLPGFPLFGVAAFALFSLYLLGCCVKGNAKFGVRLFFWKLYPIEWKNTRVNSFLVNTWIILICTIPIIQFCAEGFPEYARLTELSLLFGTQIQYIEGLSILWALHVFIWIILVTAFISLVWLFVNPDDTSRNIDAEIKKRAHA